jgi:hypothetical protein
MDKQLLPITINSAFVLELNALRLSHPVSRGAIQFIDREV